MAAIVYILVCLVWGSSWIFIKTGLETAPPLYAATIRFVIAIAILFTIIAARRYPLPDTFRDTLRLAYPGLYLYGLHTALIYFAQLYISTALASVLFASFPMFVALLSARLLPGQPLRRIAWLGLALGMAGIVLISTDSLRLSGNLFLGTLLALGGAFAAAYGMVLHIRNFAERNIVVASTLQIALGTVPLLFAALLVEDIAALQLTATTTIASILYLAVVATIGAFLMYYWLMRRLRAVTLSLTAFITPLVAGVIGIAFFGESLNALTIVGAAAILASVLLVARSGDHRPPETQSTE